MLRMAHRIWKESKQQPGTAGTGNMLGCCLASFHFLWAILSTSTVVSPVFVGNESMRTIPAFLTLKICKHLREANRSIIRSKEKSRQNLTHFRFHFGNADQQTKCTQKPRHIWAQADLLPLSPLALPQLVPGGAAF